MLRKIFKKNLALKFTAVKKSGERKIFKLTNTYKKMKGTFNSAL